MEQLSEILEYFALTKLEAKVYLASLQVGRGTAYEIAKKAGIKRPTGYVLASGLVSKGLMTSQEEKGKTWYAPTPPTRLIEMWKGRLAVLEATIPDLNALYRVGTEKPFVQTFEGKIGVDAVYNEMIGVRDTKGDYIRLITNIAAVQKDFNYLVIPWRKTAKDKRNKVHELLNKGPGVLEYAEGIRALGNPNYHLRQTKTDVLGEGDNYIYKNKVAIISLKNGDLFATVIESEQVAKTYKALFDMAWEVGEKV